MMQNEREDKSAAIKKLEAKDEELVKKRYFLMADGAIKYGPQEWCLPQVYSKFAQDLHNFEAKSDDVYVLGFPKSGTTWMQEIVWSLVFNPDLDNPKATAPIDKRVLHLEGDMYLNITGVPKPDPEGSSMKMFQRLRPGKDYSDGLVLTIAAYLPSPRAMKTHLPVSLMPKKTLMTSKVIYVLRDARDVISSYYHFSQCQNMLKFNGTLDDFIDDIINDRVPYSPYWTHMYSAWEERNNPNVCLIFYEDMKEDVVREIKKVDKLLGTNRSDSQMQNIAQYTKFDKMKERFTDVKKDEKKKDQLDYKDFRTMDSFFRKGEAGNWNEKFTPTQLEKINGWIAANISRFGPNFKYKI